VSREIPSNQIHSDGGKEGYDCGDDGVGHCDDWVRASECAVLVLSHAQRWVEGMHGKCEWGKSR